MLIGPENTLYLLDLRAVMKGPEEQSLEHAAICSIQLLTDSEDQQSDPYQFLLEENSVCSLTWSIHDLEMTAKIIFYSLRSKVNKKEVTKLRGSELFQIEKLISDCFSCKILPNDTLAIGYYCKQEAVAQEHPKGRIIRLMLLQYERISNQLRQISDETYPIDDLYLSQLPQFSDSFHEQSLSFVEHKKKVFCVASLHMEKQVKQIFCLHRHRFVPIGGTNCNRPGQI